ncbi:hypothetical protein D3C81_2082860 [compost metagenome]
MDRNRRFRRSDIGHDLLQRVPQPAPDLMYRFGAGVCCWLEVVRSGVNMKKQNLWHVNAIALPDAEQATSGRLFGILIQLPVLVNARSPRLQN